MLEWVNETLESGAFGLAVFPAAFVLGFAGAVTSVCNLALVGAIAGYCGGLSGRADRRRVMLSGLFFIIGSAAALAILGAVTGLISGVIGTAFGSYWKLLAGFVLVLLGLGTLDVMSMKVPGLGGKDKGLPAGNLKAMMLGFVIGGGVVTCSACCNPALFAVLGMAAMSGRVATGAGIMGAFAAGYSVPLVVAVLGLGAVFDKLKKVTQKFEKFVRMPAGIILIALGLYLLATLR